MDDRLRIDEWLSFPAYQAPPVVDTLPSRRQRLLHMLVAKLSWSEVLAVSAGTVEGRARVGHDIAAANL